MELTEIVEEYHLKLLFVFGSSVTERANSNSDIDVGYIAKSPLTPEQEAGLLRMLVFYFKRDRIDLVDMNKANPLLLFEAAGKARILYEEKDGFLRFQTKAFARYAETKFLREMRKDYLQRSISERLE